MLEFSLDFKDLKRDLDRLADRSTITRAYKKALEKVADQIQKDAKNKTPEGTKELLNSWVKEWDGDDLLAGYDIIYAMYQHQGRRDDGTHIIRNRPAGGETYYLKNTLDQNANKYFELFETEFFNNLGL